MKCLFLVLIVFVAGHLRAQFPEYCVYLVKGSVRYGKVNAPLQPVKQKQLLFADERIVLQKGGGIELVDKEARYIVVSRPGTYRVKDLRQRLPNQSPPGLTKMYLQLVYHEVLDPNYDFTRFRNQLGGAYAAASRGGDCNNLVFPAEDSKLPADTLRFVWTATSPSGGYTLTLFDGGGKEVFSRKLNDTTLVLPFTVLANGRPGRYYWLVQGAKAACESEVPLRFDVYAPSDEAPGIAPLLRDTAPFSIPGQLHKIEVLERHGYIIKAIGLFSDLVNGNPGDTALRKSYIAFLLRYGFTAEAKQQWERLSIKAGS